MSFGKAKLGLVLLPAVVLTFALRASGAEQISQTTKFAHAAQVESSFRGRSFILAGDDQVALVRAPDWEEGRSLRLPFWLGTGNVVPSAMRPKESGYYVISEAYIVRSLGGKEWLIRAGSSLQKPDAVFITGKTRYKTTGIILPTIVQYVGTRSFTRTDGSTIQVPVLEEVSLPMKWTAPGRVPQSYATFTIRK